jgi:SLT domain-containing protein
MFNIDFYYTSDDDCCENENVNLSLTVRETQQLKYLLSTQINEQEKYRQSCAGIAQCCARDNYKQGKDYYWKLYGKATDKINKLAKIQQKIKRSL